MRLGDLRACFVEDFISGRTIGKLGSSNTWQTLISLMGNRHDLISLGLCFL
jgi:hypothetical protein